MRASRLTTTAAEMNRLPTAGGGIPMKQGKIWATAGAVLMTAALLALPARAQTQASPLPLPPAVEKELAARASNVTEVTLGKNMLGFAAKFMNGKDDDEAATRKLI